MLPNRDRETLFNAVTREFVRKKERTRLTENIWINVYRSCNSFNIDLEGSVLREALKYFV